ncbi:UDP-N-acetylglucosamine transferase subunit [Elasticomyces elasticus]|uniref:UDP-N-acetylglucosamine transferase subunit ALG14 n=1 Tax=Exophiala sideris TaxID=1016849 RepID=A0ABR0JD17_9EURO|nr:UDP-N-acetylglucosamine transferase subunit [Elasticomyces elasticus]KAK5031907.1 UDP-N-acetylglucosamine transferase subunit [Exophiala sideris]KAK5040836.1 UDP-N-acetylglucosamine transferase subunit [Exophiala sideris]KAK5061829.1 UDP-N-acetylglucosamine transferase subunit [Exophiala sideris]KAK5184529.1 UDP-N-acetylglucosamine transferase subunit [Eurotiomycetes sp. CCFEE 6388]
MDTHHNPPDTGSLSYFWSTNFKDHFTSLPLARQLVLLGLVVFFVLTNLTFFRLATILSRPQPSRRPRGLPSHPTHLLVVLGSGGHTAEMLNILSQNPGLQNDFTHRTYVVSSGDDFSALKAHEFEKQLLSYLASTNISTPESTASKYDVVTVRRARRVHQSILTTPISSLVCLSDCFAVLTGSHYDIKPARPSRNKYPDLILTNGPGTGVIVVLASLLLLFLGYGGPSTVSTSANSKDADKQDLLAGSGQMRSIFIESWARVKTLSLSGRLLKPLVNRFIVQWPELVKSEGDRVEYIGPLVT